MRTLIKSSFVWQFAGGFVLGAVALLAIHPAESGSRLGEPVAAHATLQ